MQIAKILVPTDFSKDASAALDYAIELARDFDAEIHLLHAYQPMAVATAPYGVAIPMEMTESIRQAATTALDEWKDRVEKAGVEAQVHLTPDVPSSAIAAAAKSLEVDLIVMGTRGLSGLRHILMGSVAERSVRTAPCPVLTVKADD